MFDSGRSRATGVAVLVGSMGATPILREVLGGLAEQFVDPVLVVQHRHSDHPDHLTQILRTATALPVRPLQHGDVVERGVWVVPPRTALTFTETGAVSLLSDDGWPGDGVLRACADRFGGATTAVVLSGRLDDGAKGVRAVKSRGGRVIVQDPTTARAASMPTHALATGCVDLVLPPRLIAPALTALVLAPGARDLFAVAPPPWAAVSVPQ